MSTSLAYIACKYEGKLYFGNLCGYRPKPKLIPSWCMIQLVPVIAALLPISVTLSFGITIRIHQPSPLRYRYPSAAMPAILLASRDDPSDSDGIEPGWMAVAILLPVVFTVFLLWLCCRCHRSDLYFRVRLPPLLSSLIHGMKTKVTKVQEANRMTLQTGQILKEISRVGLRQHGELIGRQSEFEGGGGSYNLEAKDEKEGRRNPLSSLGGKPDPGRRRVEDTVEAVHIYI